MTGPVTIRGVTYPSTTEAAQALDVTRTTVKLAMLRGRLDSVGLRGSTPMPVRIRGKVYKSAKAAAKALKVSKANVYAMVTVGREDLIGIGTGKRADGSHSGGLPKKPITIAGVPFASLHEASLLLGLRPAHVGHVMRHGGDRARKRIEKLAEEYRDRLINEAMDASAARDAEKRRSRLKS